MSDIAVRAFQAGRLRVRVYANRQEMGAAAAHDAANHISRLLSVQARVSVVFASAPSQKELLEHLVSATVEWRRVVAFHMDEYVALPPDAPQRFGSYLHEALFRHVPLQHVHYLNGNAPDLQAECNRYADLLKASPVDIVCLGIGENGHIAFNDPGIADFKDPRLVKIVDLDERSRHQQVHDGCFSSLSKVPYQAITLTVPALMAAKALYCVVPGKTKAEAVHDCLVMPISTERPASILRTHPDATLYIDTAAAELLDERMIESLD